jgi:translation elongation factor EF-1alpha
MVQRSKFVGVHGSILYRLFILISESMEIPSRPLDSPLRMSISDLSRGSRANVVNVVGQLESGIVQVGDSVISEPGGNKGTVRSEDLRN